MRNLLFPLLCAFSSLSASAQWQSVSNPVPIGTELNDCQLDVVDAQVAWFTNTFVYVPPFTAQVSRTLDGGRTWQSVGPTAPATGGYTFATLEAIDAQHAWLATERSGAAGATPVRELHYTGNGGTTWSARPLPTTTLRTDMLRFFTSTEGLILDQITGSFFRTTDAGLTWQLQSGTPALLTGQRASGLSLAGNALWTTIYTAQMQPVAFWMSTDRGLTWRSQALSGVPYGKPVFRDAQHALMASPTGTVSTADGGLTWQNAATPACGIYALAGIPGASAYVAGAIYSDGNTTVQKGSAITHDDGQTWTMLETTNSYFNIQFTSPTAGWHIRSVISPAVANYLYQGIGRYTGSALANRPAAPAFLALDVFPNPSTSGVFTVRLPAAAGRLRQVQVTDALGRTVYRAAHLPADQRLDLSRQLKGLYSLQVQTDTGVARQKLLVE